MPARKWCFVPQCKNTTYKTPDKTFITVPRDAKRRQKWFAAARRDIKEVSEKSTLYCCEDHFRLEEDMENYVEYKLSKVSARLKPNVLPHLFACQSDESSWKKRIRESSEERSRTKLIIELMEQSKQEIKTEITEESIKVETSQLVENLPSISGITIPDLRREVACQTKKFYFRSIGVQVDWEMKDAETSPLKTVVSDLRKPAVKMALHFNKRPVEPKLISQPVDTFDSTDIYQPRESTGSDESQLKSPTEEQKIAKPFNNIIEEKLFGDYKLGKLIIEGKTKQVYEIQSHPEQCLLLSKDRITAGDGVKAHDLKGKAVVSNKTTCKVFEILNSVGIPTSFVKCATETSFVSKKCEMIPIEWVTRRLATGSFLKRHPGVKEGYRFAPVKHETFFKDDANHDPQWSEEQLISAKFKLNGVLIGEKEVDYMTRISILVFEILEKVWQIRNCALIDMKIEFGITTNGEIVVADVIDSDSWRLWPSGDKRLMVDKQVYRNLLHVTDKDLDTVKRNFEWVVDQLDHLLPPSDHLVVIIMGSPSDKDHCNKIRKYCEDLGLNVEIRVSSAHKTTEGTLKIISHYESLNIKIVFIAVAGRSNGLGPVISGNSDFPVINCPPLTKDDVDRDIWSSLNVPSGLGCSTVVYPESAALAAAQSIALTNYIVWSKLRVKRLNNYKILPNADEEVRNK